MDGTGSGALDSESYFIIQQFQNGAYKSALSAFSALSSPTDHVKLYAARSYLALEPPSVDEASAVLGTLRNGETLDARAVNALAQFLQGDFEFALGELEDVLASLGDAGLNEEGGAGEEEGRMVRSVIATVFILEQSEERRDEAVELLKEGIEIGHDQDCLAVLVHLYLSLNLPQLASALLASSKSWTSDSLLSQVLAARTHLVTGPNAKYQDAYYVFEEVKSLQGGRSDNVLNGVAVAQATLARWREANEALLESAQLNDGHADTLANTIALALHNGRPVAEADAALVKLQQVAPAHRLVSDLDQKGIEFDEVASKFGLTRA